MKPALARRLIRNYGFERARFLRSKLRRLLNLFLDREQDIEIVRGLKLHLDLDIPNQNEDFWYYEEHEPELQWLIRNLLPPAGTMVDAGANFGFFGMVAMHCRAARVHFIEPHPRLAASIRRHLSLNFYGPLGKVHELAASDANGSAVLNINAGKNDGCHSLLPLKNSRESLSVPCRRLEDLFREEGIAHVDLLKMDVENHDLNVLHGLGEFLQPRNISVLFVEMNSDRQACWDWLSARGYVAFETRRFYIDALRREYRQGNLTPFYAPASAPTGKDYVWVPKDSPAATLLNQVVRY